MEGLLTLATLIFLSQNLSGLMFVVFCISPRTTSPVSVMGPELISRLSGMFLQECVLPVAPRTW